MHKKKKYATIDFSGMNFRNISTELKKEGYNVGASRVRTIMLKSLKGIAKAICRKEGISISNERLNSIVVDSEFQNNIAPFIEEAYKK